MDEFELIHRFFLPAERSEGVVLGVGDDGAVLATTAGRHLVAVVDTLIDGVHYPAGFPARDVGFRAVAVNLSDIAAMGGVPRWMTLALTIPRSDEDWLQDFASGLFEAAGEHGVAMVGGDTTRGEQTVISVHVLGEVTPAAYLTRTGAGPDEDIYVTGTVGDAAAGLHLLQHGYDRGDADANWLVARFSRPTARVGFGQAIAGIATAAIDLSDGLGTDLDKLLRASHLAGTLDLEALPISAPLRRSFDAERRGGFALDGGDDYELCFTARQDERARLKGLAAERGFAMTRIGATRAGEGLFCARGDAVVRYHDRGYRHF